MSADIKESSAREQAAIRTFQTFLRENREELRLLAHWGDGHGAYLLSILQQELGVVRRALPSKTAPKTTISRALAKRVFERDAYRCVICGGHHDLTCDHVVPESKGGPTTFENLQTMCKSCNSRKGART